MRPEDADGLTALNEQRLVVAEAQQRPHDRLERVVRARGAAGAAVDDEVLGPLGDFGIEVVQQHPQRRLGLPRAGVQLCPVWGADPREVAASASTAASSDETLTAFPSQGAC